jgi:hypothetical protein
MEYQGIIKILNATGQSVNFVGGFLLTVEAIRVARIANLAQSLEEVSKVVTSPTGGTPLPLRWYFVIACATFSGAVWLFAPYLLLFTITPTLLSQYVSSKLPTLVGGFSCYTFLRRV